MSEQISFNEEMKGVHGFLGEHVGKLPQKDQQFANSLVKWGKDNNSWSDKQWFWAKKLAATIGGATTTSSSSLQFNVPEREIEPVMLGSMSKMLAVFETAKGSLLKNPFLILDADVVGEIKLYPASPNSKWPGAIYVVQVGGRRAYLGRILNGMFHPSKDEQSTADSLLQILHKFSLDPAKTVSDYGKKSGRCSFCRLPLTDEDSLQAGYGKQCAKKWGMPYGKQAFKAEAV